MRTFEIGAGSGKLQGIYGPCACAACGVRRAHRYYRCRPSPRRRAYRYGPFSAQIERRVGRIEPETVAHDKPGSFDLIFLDADHSYTAVKNDTNILLGLLSERGYFVWHDYANWGKVGGKNGVPEYLHELCNEMPVAQCRSVARFAQPAWRIASGADEYRRALAPSDNVAGSDPWTIEAARG